MLQQKTNTSLWCHDEGDTAALVDGYTAAEALRLCQEVRGASCCLQFKLQIHLQYISQECSQLKCKLRWVWKIFKKYMDLALRRITFSCAKKKKRGESPNTSHHHRGKGQPTQQMIYSKTILYISPHVFIINFITGPMFSAQWEMGVWRLLCSRWCETNQGERAVSTLVTFQGPWYKYQTICEAICIGALYHAPRPGHQTQTGCLPWHYLHCMRDK